MEAWTTRSLGELGDALIGLTYSPSQITRFGGTLVLRSSNIQNGQLALHDVVRVKARIPDRIKVRPSDILICVRNGSRPLIGKSLYLDDRVSGETFGAFMAVFRSPANSFLRYFFESESFKRQVDEHLGATINQITNRSLNSFIVMLPGELERNEISHRLSDVDTLIRSLESLISKKRAIKQAVMQELLHGKTRLPTFHLPWTHLKLGDIGSFFKGRGIKREDVRSSGIPCIRYGELYTTYSDYTSATISFVDGFIAKTALPIRKGDILFAGSGETKEEIGKCVAYLGDAPAVAGGDIIVFRGHHCDPVFLASLLNSHPTAIQKARGGQGDAVVHVNSRTLSAIDLCLPDIEEQRAIALAIRESDCEIEALERRLKSTRAIKQGMMQELLTGRTRLPVEEVPQ